MEKDGYNYDRATGWIYGGWTGWKVELPAIDGPIPHTHMDGNVADVEGKFNVSEAGDYYVVIKFGKGDDGGTEAGASFGDGIALDNLNLKRVGELNACKEHDGTEAGNLLKGGEFEECDDKYWGIVASGQGKDNDGDDKKDNIGTITFGDTSFSPAGGAGGSLHFADNFAGGDVNEYGAVVYQEVTLEAADYNLKALVKHSGEGTTAGKMNNYWFEFVLSDEKPTLETGGLDSKRLIGGFSQWDGTVDMPAANGNMDFSIHNGATITAGGTFTVITAGTYWLSIKQGACCDGAIRDGISLDKLVLKKN